MRSCKETARLHASGDVDRIGWIRRLAVRFHLLICHNCRRYVQQLELIGDASREVARAADDLVSGASPFRENVLEDVRQQLRG